MKKIFFSLTIAALLFACAKWDLLGPDEDIILLNVRVHFDFETQKVNISNKNWNSSHVQISRRTSEYNYLEICDVYIGGNQSKIISTSFSHGNKMKLRVRILNDEDKLIDQTTYFQLF